MARSKHGSPPKRAKRYNAPKTIEDKIARRQRNLAAPGNALQDAVKAQIVQAANRKTKLSAVLNQPMDADRLEKIEVVGRLAFDALVDGNGGMDELAHVGQAMNIAIILAERGIGHEHQEDIQKALDAVYGVKLRLDEGGKDVLNPEHYLDDVRAIELGLDIHDEQMKIATHAEVVLAIAEVNRRVADNQHVYKEAA